MSCSSLLPRFFPTTASSVALLISWVLLLVHTATPSEAKSSSQAEPVSIAPAAGDPGGFMDEDGNHQGFLDDETGEDDDDLDGSFSLDEMELAADELLAQSVRSGAIDVSASAKLLDNGVQQVASSEEYLQQFSLAGSDTIGGSTQAARVQQLGQSQAGLTVKTAPGGELVDQGVTAASSMEMKNGVLVYKEDESSTPEGAGDRAAADLVEREQTKLEQLTQELSETQKRHNQFKDQLRETAKKEQTKKMNKQKNKKTLSGFLTKWKNFATDWFQPGYCREAKRSTNYHTAENCYSPSRCSDPRIRQVCLTQGFVQMTDNYVLFKSGNGCRAAPVTEVDAKTGRVIRKNQNACVPLRHYCAMQWDGISCGELEGCEWVVTGRGEESISNQAGGSSSTEVGAAAVEDVDPSVAPVEKKNENPPRLSWRNYETTIPGVAYLLPDLPCDPLPTARRARREPCFLKEPKAVDKKSWWYWFLTSRVTKLSTSAQWRYERLTRRDLSYNVPRNDCGRCKEVSTHCYENSQCCSNKCAVGPGLYSFTHKKRCQPVAGEQGYPSVSEGGITVSV
ncbi:unnamed protein product [Amoebophrya sp. A120]|nr:unnamed protein product [Amoebophrya sp. A120]|eukprot:GSA120T00023331001.1